MKRRAESQLTKDSVFDSEEISGEIGTDYASAEEIKSRRIIKVRKGKKKGNVNAPKPESAASSGFQFSFGASGNGTAKAPEASNGASSASTGFQFSFTPQQETSSAPAASGFQFSFTPQQKEEEKKGSVTSDATGGFSFSFGGADAAKDSAKDTEPANDAPASTGSGFAFAFMQAAEQDKSDDTKKDTSEGFKFSFDSTAASSTTTPASSSEWNFSFVPDKMLNEEKKEAASTGDSSDTKWDFSNASTAGTTAAAPSITAATTTSTDTTQYNSPFGSVKGDSSWTEGKDYTPPEDRSSKVEAVKLNDKPRETGEEGEKTIVECPVKLYELVDKEWKERGVGTLKLNETDAQNARFIMRTKETHTVKLNARLFAGMPHTKQGDKSLILMLYNAATIDDKPKSTEGEEAPAAVASEPKLSQVLVRTKESSDINKIYDYIETHYKKQE